MKIYMISPPQDESFWGFEQATKWQGYKVNFMPLGIITVAAIAENLGHEVKVTDARFQKIDYDTDADIVCISFYNIQKIDAFNIAKRFRNKGKYVVFGGAYPISSPDECLEHADTVICGEGEYTFSSFLKDYEKGKQKRLYNSQKVDMRDSPIPAYHLLDIKKYRSAGINFTRGCPFTCEFCDIKEEWFNGRTVRMKKPKQIIEELNILKKYNVKHVFIHDDNFIGNPTETKILLKEIIKWQKKSRYKFSFTVEASLNIVHDKELLRLFREANFTTVFVGIESPNVESLKITKKIQNTAGDIIKNIINVQRNGISLTAGMITGFDGDKKDIFPIMYKFIQKTGILVTSLGPLMVLPGTPLEARMKKEKRLLKKEMYHPAFLNKKGCEMNVNYIPKHMTGEELVEGTNWLLKKIYSHKGFTRRYWQYVKNLGKNTKNIEKLGVTDISSVPLSRKIKFIKEIFLSSPKQFYYNTKLLLKVFLFKPLFVPSCFANLAVHNHMYLYYKKIIGDPDKVKGCPVKLTIKERVIEILEKIQKVPNPSVPVEKNAVILCEAVDEISRYITKENVKKAVLYCKRRLNEVKSKDRKKAYEELIRIKDELISALRESYTSTV